MGIGSEFEENGVNIPLQIPERRAGKQMPPVRRWVDPDSMARGRPYSAS